METTTINIPKRPQREFISEELVVDSWHKIETYFKDLLDRKIHSVTALERWMLDRSELEAVLEEEQAWRYIKMNIDTRDKELGDAFSFWVKEISPNVAPYNHKLNLKLKENPFYEDLDKEKYRIYLRGLDKAIEIYRDENISLFTEMQTKQQEYGAIAAKMTVDIDGEKMTMQKAAKYLKSTNRAKREEVFAKVNERRIKDRDTLDKLFDELIALRQKIAYNAGFDNYRDYKFAEMGRFDYTPSDCYDFHASIAQEITPIVNQIDQNRKDKMGLESYKPWDTLVDDSGKESLKPFKDEKELIDKTIKCFHRLRPYFGECLEVMKAMNHLDLESKEGKAPGGFNYPLYEIGVPFIYMNAVGSQRDLVTMVHEGGHAVHSFLTRELDLCEFKSVPSEVAELASMAMELLSMETWDEFYTDENELKRAKSEQLEKVLSGLPWIAAIDKFQHWIYTTEHTAEERRAEWANIIGLLGSSVIDWKGNETAYLNQWQKQLHLYEVPFYYIEYGMAQLGAIALWRSYKIHGEKALDNYINALRLGYTKSISELYQEAGIEFNFSQEYVKELADFVKLEMAKI